MHLLSDLIRSSKGNEEDIQRTIQSWWEEGATGANASEVWEDVTKSRQNTKFTRQPRHAGRGAGRGGASRGANASNAGRGAG